MIGIFYPSRTSYLGEGILSTKSGIEKQVCADTGTCMPQLKPGLSVSKRFGESVGLDRHFSALRNPQ